MWIFFLQAAIGGIALDTAVELDAGDEAIELGRKVCISIH